MEKYWFFKFKDKENKEKGNKKALSVATSKNFIKKKEKQGVKKQS